MAIEENIVKMKSEMVGNEKDLNKRNENLRTEIDKLREELAKSRAKNAELKEKLDKTETELLKKIDFSQHEDTEISNNMNTSNTTFGDTSSSVIAQNLLRKLIKYEEENNRLKYEKEKRNEEELKEQAKHLESINLIYSIVSDNFMFSGLESK